MSTAILPPPIYPVSTPFSVRNPQSLRCNVAEFYEMGDRGEFDQRHVMLIDGEILEMPLANPPHATAEGLVEEILRTIFATGYVVRAEKPLPLNQMSDPVPDIAVVSGSIRDYARNHPKSAVLVVEVSDSSLPYDTGDKSSLNAAAAIADYWVVDLVHRQLVVMRDPVVDAGQRFGYGYATVTTLAIGQSASPLAAPGAVVAVADLMP
ncbi:MAG TPA: Uma2 family endonuclease [Gemmataceae bacterium]|jgi:Uma2 family endonuclease|nr:Uma2 family endonuclease [Gemmataceae bacterium]